jgi:hypothetical protein
LKHNKFIGFLILALFAIAPFIQSDTSDESQSELLRSIPPAISLVTSYLRWIIMFVLVGYCLYAFKSIKHYFTKINFFYALFYLIPLLYALVTLKDVNRYVSLFTLSSVLPVVIASQFVESEGLFTIKKFKIVIVICLVLSFIVSFNAILAGLRFQGILANPNMYGITAVFWLAIIQLSSKKNKYDLILSSLILITIILSGSRGSLLAALTLTAFSYVYHVKKIIIGLVVFSILLYVTSLFLDLNFLLKRFEGIADSAETSGRAEIWGRAFRLIELNPFGNGMDAPLELLNTGNVHNSYVRYIFTMGYFFGISTILIFITLIWFAIKNNRIPRPLVGFLLGFALACYGEDFFIGLGSSIFVYLLITIGLINYYDVKRSLN